MRSPTLNVLLAFFFALLTTMSCKQAKFELVKKDQLSGPPEAGPEFEIQGPKEGTPNQTLIYTSKNCQNPEEVTWSTGGEIKTGSGPQFEVSFKQIGDYTVTARCADQEESLDISINKGEGSPGNNQNQNQNQNKKH